MAITFLTNEDKTIIDQNIAQLSEEIADKGNVKTVNGVKPDENGNVTVSGDGVVIDKTLSVAGAAADAKATGDTIIEKLHLPVTKSGSVVKVDVVEGLPLKIVSEVMAAQSGEGTPSIDNVRSFIPRTSVTATVSNGSETQTYSAQLGENVYLGTYDFSSGLLTVTGEIKPVVPVARDNPYNDAGFCQYWMWGLNAVSDGDAFQLSTFAPHVFANKTGREHFWALNDTLMFESNRWQTLEDAQVWFRANDAKILYMLKKPYTVQIAHENIMALEGITTVTSDAGDVTVTGAGFVSALEQTPRQKYGKSMLRYIHMPRVLFTGDTKQMSASNAVVMEFEYRGAEDRPNGVREGGVNHKCWAKVKWQGSSSIGFPKKNYTVTLYADEACTVKKPITFRAKWGAHSKYCLKANYIDPSQCRNVVAAKTYAQCVETRNPASESHVRMKGLPNFGAIDGYPILVFINDEYNGMYTFNIPKDEWMFGMTDGEGRNVVLCSEMYCDATNFSAAALIDGSDWGYEVSPADKSWVAESFNRISTAVAMPQTTAEEISAKRTALEACVDIWSVMDYDIFVHRVGASDNMKKNMLMICYDDIWCAGAYDLDTAWCNEWAGTKYIDMGYSVESNALCVAVKTLWAEEYKARKSWLQAQAWSPLHSASISDKLFNFMVDIPQEAYAAEAEIWPEMCGANTNAMQQIITCIMLRDAMKY